MHALEQLALSLFEDRRPREIGPRLSRELERTPGHACFAALVATARLARFFDEHGARELARELRALVARHRRRLPEVRGRESEQTERAGSAWSRFSRAPASPATPRHGGATPPAARRERSAARAHEIVDGAVVVTRRTKGANHG